MFYSIGRQALEWHLTTGSESFIGLTVIRNPPTKNGDYGKFSYVKIAQFSSGRLVADYLRV